MAKKYDFRPDKPHATWLSQLQLTQHQRKQVLKWCLYAVVIMILSVAQDVVLCRFRFFGGTTELVPCGIFLICIIEGSHKGCVFALCAALFYLFSGSSPGPHVLVLITVPAIFVAILRQTFLQPGWLSAQLCSWLAMVLYEALVFAFCLLLGFVQVSHLFSFLVPAVLSPVAIPILYPIARSISAIGGESWKE